MILRYVERILKLTMFSSLTLDRNKKLPNWISTAISSEKVKPFDTSFKPAISYLPNGRVLLLCIVTLS